MEPLELSLRERHSGTPVGIKNIGNTCYFNALIQIYFHFNKFPEVILKHKTTEK